MNRKPKKADAILALDPNSIFVIREPEIEWVENPSSLNEEHIQAKLAELQADYDSKQYQRDRSTEYPELPEQLDMLFHAIDAGALDKTSAFYTTLKAVKDKYPKG